MNIQKGMLEVLPFLEKDKQIPLDILNIFQLRSNSNNGLMDRV